MHDFPRDFLNHIRGLEQSYLEKSDPIEQSGFGGGPGRWRTERGAILDAIDHDGDLLDVGCANGFLLECLVSWAREQGIKLTPYGVDIAPRLIELARSRLTQYEDHFWVANAWDWTPPRQFDYVYALYDCAPTKFLPEYLRRLYERAVVPGGRLILGAYGSQSENEPAFDVKPAIAQAGFDVSGETTRGELPIVRFAWVDKPDKS